MKECFSCDAREHSFEKYQYTKLQNTLQIETTYTTQASKMQECKIYMTTEENIYSIIVIHMHGVF